MNSYHLRCGQQVGAPGSGQQTAKHSPCQPVILTSTCCRVASLSSGSDHINAVPHRPLKICLFRSRFDCGAEGSFCLRAVPVELFSSDQSLVSLCGSSKRPAKHTGKVRHAFYVLLSFSGNQRECSPAGMRLPLLSLSQLLQTAVCFGNALLDCLCCVDLNKDARAGESTGCSVCRKPQWNASCLPAECLHCELLRTSKPT